MNTLGELLAAFEDPQKLFGVLAATDDQAVINFLAEHERATGCTPQDIVFDAVQAFTSSASADAWLKLIGRMQGAWSPGAVCLSEILTWAMQRDARPPSAQTT
ncbi:MAG: hypothetical protein LCH56_14030 [Proteobacteria bacterium]|nr:hypothetical protein [Pseudomonadota bacterium]